MYSSSISGIFEGITDRPAQNVGTPVKGHYGFTHDTTSDEVVKTLKDQITGKTILITGVTPGGLGAQTALSLAQGSPALLILASRDASKIEALVSELSSTYPNVKTQSLVLDLGSFASIRTASSTILALDRPVDVVINNAGVMMTPYGKTVDGFETQFGVNHVGHFLFTNLIMPKLLEAAEKKNEAVIVNVSSVGHRYSPVRWDDIGFSDGKAYDRIQAYGQSKTANILFSLALKDKLAAKGIRSYSLHPGGINTNLGRHIPEADMADFLKKAGDIQWKSLQQGAATQIVAAFDPTIAYANGGYLEDCNISQPKEYTRDPKDAERLWKLSEELVGQSFSY